MSNLNLAITTLAAATGVKKADVKTILEHLKWPYWHHHASGLKEALKEAVPENRMVFVVFTAANCGHCTALEDEVLYTSFFSTIALWNHWLLVNIAFPNPISAAPQEDLDLKQQYQVSGFPTVITLNADGTERGRIVGYKTGTGVAKWLRDNFGIELKPIPISMTPISAGQAAQGCTGDVCTAPTRAKPAA